MILDVAMPGRLSALGSGTMSRCQRGERFGDRVGSRATSLQMARQSEALVVPHILGDPEDAEAGRSRPDADRPDPGAISSRTSDNYIIRSTEQQKVIMLLYSETTRGGTWDARWQSRSPS